MNDQPATIPVSPTQSTALLPPGQQPSTNYNTVAIDTKPSSITEKKTPSATDQTNWLGFFVNAFNALRWVMMIATIGGTTTVSLAASIANLLQYCQNPSDYFLKKEDLKGYDIYLCAILLCSLLFSVAGFVDTQKYLGYLKKCFITAWTFRYNPDAFNELITSNNIKQFAAVTSSAAKGTAIAPLITHLIMPKDTSQFYKVLFSGSTSVAGFCACLASSRAYYAAKENSSTSTLKAVVASIFMSIFSSTNTIKDLLELALRKGSAMMISLVTLFCGMLLIYYYCTYRTSFKTETSEESQCITKLKACFNRCYNCCSKETQHSLAQLTQTLNTIAIGMISAAMVYALWQTWHNAAKQLGVIEQDSSDFVPKSTFDITILCVTFYNLFMSRFARFETSTNSSWYQKALLSLPTTTSTTGLLGPSAPSIQ